MHLNSTDYSAFLQDSWKILPNLTADAGLRFDRTDIKGFDGKVVSRLTNQWQPRIGIIWDPSKQGTSKVYAFYGRFYYATPTDINVRDFGSELFVTTYNFDPLSTVHDPTAPGHPRPDQQGGAFNEPVDPNLHGMYQDEVTLGVEKALDPTFSVEVKGMYRRLGNAIDDRCDLDYSAPVNLGNSCANINPGGTGLWASGNFPWYDGYSLGGFHDAPAPQSPKAKRLYRAIQLSARKTVGSWLWLQASYVFSSVRGNYDGAVHESTGQTDPGLNEDFDYPATYPNAYGKLFLDRPHQFRLDAAYTAPFGLTAGLQFYVRSGVPFDQLRSDWPDYLGSDLYMVPRGSGGPHADRVRGESEPGLQPDDGARDPRSAGLRLQPAEPPVGDVPEHPVHHRGGGRPEPVQPGLRKGRRADAAAAVRLRAEGDLLGPDAAAAGP